MTLQLTHAHNNCLDTNVLTLLSWSVLTMCYQSRLWDERGRERFISPSSNIMTNTFPCTSDIPPHMHHTSFLNPHLHVPAHPHPTNLTS